MAKRWYVVHAYSGYEKHVMRSLIERVKLAGMEDEFGEILVPTEEVVEMRNGQKRKSERKFFPGYVLVQMDMNEGTWHLVKDTPRVMGFIGGTAASLRLSPIKKPRLFCVALPMVATSRSQKRSLSQVKWFVLLTVPLLISTVPLKKLTTKRAGSKWRCSFSVALLR